MAISKRLIGLRMSKKAYPKNLLALKTKYVVGLNSGTSADGIDAALVKIEGAGEKSQVHFIKGATVSYSKSLKDRIKHCAEPGFDSANAWLELDCELADLFAKAALKIIKSADLKPNDIALIGSHGQTIRHLPKTNYGSITHQIADPARIAVLTGITTVGDFRVADTAAKGQGAPLTPIVNAILFGKIPGATAVLNIGGIANISVIERKGGQLSIFGCDTGPGNMPIDYLANKLFKKEYDKGGRLASAGFPRWGIINQLLKSSFFNQKGPKSAGREDFGAKYGEELYRTCRKESLSKQDIMATVSMLTVMAIQRCTMINRLKFDRLILTGGGAHNSYIVKALKKIFEPTECPVVDNLGYPGDYLEAVSFAVLANETINSNKYDLSSVTGAAKSVVLGKICQC
jgi:anhydro-N-acetylmuramic acid kinase